MNAGSGELRDNISYGGIYGAKPVPLLQPVNSRHASDWLVGYMFSHCIMTGYLNLLNFLAISSNAAATSSVISAAGLLLNEV